ncbi:MAG TPA: DUF1801 domain-containing protein [Burkholderiaceae bacterium]|nr:DUF1801 domain-containing protein [Burkholderiaceae bacterium]HQR76057.1 DUF1801 domain-containing protein [Burkholderiaceae bacterium]
MSENKTKATSASVDAYIEAIADPARQADCRALVRLMRSITGERPAMWGGSIVGFGSYHYKYDSGREGDACATGFSSRRSDISIYLTASFPGQEELLARLGKHKMGKACLSVRRLSDVDVGVLKQLVAGSVSAVRERYR